MTRAGCYTAWGDPHIDRHVQGLLDRVVQAVRAEMGADLTAMVLAGGFGRGEGGVLRQPGGRLHVVNDFDIELVYPEPLGRLASKLRVQWRHRRRLAALAEQLATEFGMKQVDLTLRGESSLAVREPRLADFDAYHGHRLLWGDADPLARQRAFAPSEISPFEGTWLLRNRGIGLVLARLYLDLPGALRPEHRENFYIELNKSVLAAGDALWILSGRYHVSYARRKDSFAELAALGYPGYDTLRRLYDQAAEYKLRPVVDQYPGQPPMALWQQVAALHVDFFLWHEGRRLGRRIASLGDWSDWSLTQPRPRDPTGALRRRLERRLGATGHCPPSMAGLRHDRLASVACPLALLAARSAVAADEAWRVLARWPLEAGPAGPDARWTLLARGLLASLHPSGEVGRFLAATEAAA